MNNHYFDANGVYTHSAPANPGSLPPPNALRLEPPRQEGSWPVRDAAGSGWKLVEDHRGRTGWRDGELAVIVAPGPLPEGWSDSPPPPAETRDYTEERRDSFELEADPVANLALARSLEAEAWRMTGDTAKAEKAMEKYQSLLALLLETKERIRSRYPYPEPGCGETEHNEAAVPGMGEPVYFLTRSGIYHAAGCSYTSATGEWLSLADIFLRKPSARACGRCTPAGEG